MSKIGRNDPCPCGSGKKYKKCCLKPTQPMSSLEPHVHDEHCSHVVDLTPAGKPDATMGDHATAAKYARTHAGFKPETGRGHRGGGASGVGRGIGRRGTV